jgi:hypothetical protein
MSSPRRIYVDSRFADRTLQGRGPFRFRVQYPEPIEFLSSRTKLFVANMSLAQTLPTIHATCFELLFLEYDTANGYKPRRFDFTSGQYDGPGLATALHSKLNSGTPLGSYTVTFTSTTNRLTVSGSGNAGFGFRFFGPGDIRDGTFQDSWIKPAPDGIDGPEYQPEHTCARVFGVPDTYQASEGKNFFIGDELVFESLHIDTRGVDTVFLACPELARGDTLSPWGARDIIAKIPLSEPHGGLMTSAGPAIHDDHVQVGRTSFRYLNFRLLDAYGTELLGLSGSVSFSLIFVE